MIAPSGPAWLERGVLDFDDPRHAERTRRLLASPLGWDDHPVLGTLWFAAGAPLEERRREHLLEAARAALPEALAGGATLDQALRTLGHVAEGVYSAPTVLARARGLGVEMPLTEAVVAVLEGRLTPAAAVARLMRRDAKAESPHG